MSDTWFKHWAKEHLLSDDLDALTDHEERIWWRLLSAASLEDERWTIPITRRLALKCKSTPEKMAKALNRMSDLGMVVLRDGAVTIANAARWNENTKNKPPSSTPEAVRERVQRHRASKSQTIDVTSNVTPCNDSLRNDPVTRFSNDHKEKEEEKEKEAEQRRYTPRPAPPSDHLGSDLPPAIREIADELAMGIGWKDVDADTYQGLVQVANEYPAEEIREARAQLRRQSKRPYPGNLYGVLTPKPPPAQLQPVGSEDLATQRARARAQAVGQ